jgi:PEP-CTERM/exosortase A-associated glycosyltransferase
MDGVHLNRDGLPADRPRAAAGSRPCTAASARSDDPAPAAGDGLRVLHVFDHSLPHHSGYSYRSLHVIQAQRALGYRTDHLTGPRQGVNAAVPDTFDGLAFARTPPPGARKLTGELGRFLAFRASIAEAVATHRPDVVHAHSPSINALAAHAVCRRFGIPLVYEIRAFWEDAAVSNGRGRAGDAKYRLVRALETRACRLADHVVPICSGLQTDLERRGIPASKMTVVPNILPAGRTAAPAPRPLAADGTLNLGFVGSFYDYEGLDLLVAYAARAKRTGVHVRITLIGGGPRLDAVRAAVSAQDVGDVVHVQGPVANADVWSWYDRFDAIVLPRKAQRLTDLVTPLKPLEAMSVGCPVIASDVGGHRELVADGVTGLLFKADDLDALACAVERLRDPASDLARVQRQALDFVAREHSLACAGARYRTVMEPLVTRRRDRVLGRAQA